MPSDQTLEYFGERKLSYRLKIAIKKLSIEKAGFQTKAVYLDPSFRDIWISEGFL